MPLSDLTGYTKRPVTKGIGTKCCVKVVASAQWVQVPQLQDTCHARHARLALMPV